MPTATERGAMDLHTFNTCDAADAAAALRTCVNIQSWITTLVQERPFPEVEILFERAAGLAAAWTNDEVDAALSAHPRIGATVPGASAEEELSRIEQAAVRAAGPTAATRWTEANVAYEARFDRIFLIRAAGRSEAEMLSALNDRMANSPEVENAVRAGQLAEIALLRLQGVVSGD